MSGASTPSAVNTSRSNSVSDVPDGPGARGSSSLNSGKKIKGLLFTPAISLKMTFAKSLTIRIFNTKRMVKSYAPFQRYQITGPANSARKAQVWTLHTDAFSTI